jgi:hypothetical protein
MYICVAGDEKAFSDLKLAGCTGDLGGPEGEGADRRGVVMPCKQVTHQNPPNHVGVCVARCVRIPSTSLSSSCLCFGLTTRNPAYICATANPGTLHRTSATLAFSQQAPSAQRQTEAVHRLPSFFSNCEAKTDRRKETERKGRTARTGTHWIATARFSAKTYLRSIYTTVVERS